MLLQVVQAFTGIVTVATRKIHKPAVNPVRLLTANYQHLTPVDKLSQGVVPRAYSTVVKSQTKNTSQILSNSTDQLTWRPWQV